MIQLIRLLPLRHNIKYTGENTKQEHHVPQKDSPTCLVEDKKRVSIIKNGPLHCFRRHSSFYKRNSQRRRGYCRTWCDVKTFALQEQYTLCRCGHSKNRSFCDGMHTKIHFDGTETAEDEPYLDRADRIDGPICH